MPGTIIELPVWSRWWCRYRCTDIGIDTIEGMDWSGLGFAMGTNLRLLWRSISCLRRR